LSEGKDDNEKMKKLSRERGWLEGGEVERWKGMKRKSSRWVEG
jgi:hypothetical protein